ncbi:MAG TPA: Rrf2 family transcriptional regulator [Tepidisphaeraceae bacterium]|jgi:Rrf2 family protein|nr:Rrf2 family transcriptional regulator [Tepidisphaeraceae bacterium]
MFHSTTTQYAIRGLSELAVRAGQESMMLDQLTAGTDLPREFLAKVFQQLVKAGILTSSKGRGGGFTLARPTHQISLMQIAQAIEGPGACDGCVLGLSECADPAPCPEHDLYKPIRQRLNDYLSTTTLADLAASVKCRKG